MIEDNELIQKIVNGETQMFSLLVERYKDSVFNLVYRFTDDYGEAEDISQEVFVTLYKKLNTYKGEAKLSTWIYRIATNKSIDWHRKKKRKTIFSLFDDNNKIGNIKSDIPPPQELYILTEEQRELQAVVNRLDEKYRIVVVMYYYQQLSCKDIAEILHISTRTVETRLYRAKKLLKKHIKTNNEHGGGMYEARQY